MEPYFYERDLAESSHWSWLVRRHNRVGGANTIARCIFASEAAIIANALNKMQSYQEEVKELSNDARRS